MTKFDLIASLTRKTVFFSLEEDGVPGVYLLPMGVADRLETQTWRNGLGDSLTAEHLEEMHARLWIASVCDADGNLLFSAEDMPAVRQFTPAALAAVSGRVMDLNGFARADAGKASTPS